MRNAALTGRFRAAVFAATFTSAGLWTLAVAEMWLRTGSQADRLTDAAATTATFIATLMLAAVYVQPARQRAEREREQNMGLLCRTLASVTRPAAEDRKTLPLRRVR